jgi:hypothetical protein
LVVIGIGIGIGIGTMVGCSSSLGPGQPDADSTDARDANDVATDGGCTGEAPNDCVQTCGSHIPIPRICSGGAWVCPSSYLPEAIAYNNDNCCPSGACVRADGTHVDAMCSAGARLCPAGSWLPGQEPPDAATD